MTQATSTTWNIKFDPCFSGSISENAREWVEEFEFYVKASGIDSDKARVLFSLKMKGVARKWLAAIANFQTMKVEDLLTKFRATFVSDDTKEAVRIALYQRCFKPESESILQYAFAIDSMCNQIDSSMTDAQKLEHTTRGLPNELKNLITVSDVKNVEQLIEKIRKFKSDDFSLKPEYSCAVRQDSVNMSGECSGGANVCSANENDRVVISKAELKSMIEVAVKNSLAQNRSCSYCHRPNHTEAFCWSKHGKPTTFSRKENQNTNLNQSKVMTQQDKIKYKTYKCHKCGKSGHIQVFCRSNLPNNLNEIPE